MKDCSKKVVSTQELFPFIRECLRNGQKVKFTVSGISMQPWIVHNRDQVLLTETNGKCLKPGDIILFQDKRGRYILHRIYKKEAMGYRTMGDACTTDDGLVESREIIGVVEKIYRKGKVISCNSPLWRFIFYIWRKLLPLREQLLTLYSMLTNIKHRINNRKIDTANYRSRI